VVVFCKRLIFVNSSHYELVWCVVSCYVSKSGKNIYSS